MMTCLLILASFYALLSMRAGVATPNGGGGNGAPPVASVLSAFVVSLSLPVAHLSSKESPKEVSFCVIVIDFNFHHNCLSL